VFVFGELFGEMHYLESGRKIEEADGGENNGVSLVGFVLDGFRRIVVERLFEPARRTAGRKRLLGFDF